MSDAARAKDKAEWWLREHYYPQGQVPTMKAEELARCLDAYEKQQTAPLRAFILRWQRIASGETEGFHDDTEALAALDAEARALLADSGQGDKG